MFSSEARSILHRNQLAEVICQFRFPDILMINTEQPAKFQEAIRSKFPLYQARKEAAPPRITGTPDNIQVKHSPATVNHQFSSADNNWRINLTCNFISLSCSHYSRWEEFAKTLDEPLAMFIRIYQPAYFTRIGLRYLNFISKRNLGLDEYRFSDLIAPQYLGILGEDEVLEKNVSSCSVDAQLQLHGGCTLKLHAGPGLVKQNGFSDGELRFIFDQDLFTAGSIPIQSSTNTLSTLHTHAYSVFRDAVLDPLWTAMDPQIT